MDTDSLCKMKGYYKEGIQSWEALVSVLVDEVCGKYLNDKDIANIKEMMISKKFIPAGRYLYYAGRERNFYNNCYAFIAEEDTREEWGKILDRVLSALMTGGGTGINLDVIRAKGSILKGTGGEASGPIALMEIIDYMGTKVRQGGSRRSALLASLSYWHPDIKEFMAIKDWDTETTKKKLADYNYKAPMDCTNISVVYDKLEENDLSYDIFKENMRRALLDGEPGFIFNLKEKQRLEKGRNPCGELISSDDSDVCNLGSLNWANIKDIGDLERCTILALKFLMCGSKEAQLPNQKIVDVRAKNNRIGMGIMGLHEWMLQRGHKYEVSEELYLWLQRWQYTCDTEKTAIADEIGCPVPLTTRGIAPTGTISMLAKTTSGIEPIFAKAYKRRFLKNEVWKYTYTVDDTARRIIEERGSELGVQDAEEIDLEDRLQVLDLLGEHTDMAISTTINILEPVTDSNTILGMTRMVYNYAKRGNIRGLTFYPNGARGSILEECDYSEAIRSENVEFVEHDICAISGKGSCG